MKIEILQKDERTFVLRVNGIDLDFFDSEDSVFGMTISEDYLGISEKPHKDLFVSILRDGDGKILSFDVSGE